MPCLRPTGRYMKSSFLTGHALVAVQQRAAAFEDVVDLLLGGIAHQWRWSRRALPSARRSGRFP